MTKIRRGEIVEADSVKKNIGVKVDEKLWARLRALALIQGRLSGLLLDEAISQYLEKHEKMKQ